MKNLIPGFLILLLLTACKKDDEKLPLGIDESQLGTGVSGEWRYQAPADVTPAPPPTAFTASTGLGFGAVTFSLAYPELVGDYARIDFRYNLGRTAPADCESGSLALSVTDFSQATFTITGLFANADYAFIACIYDHADNLTQASSMTVAKAGDARRIFMTSATFNGNFAASYNDVSFTDGLEGANYRCQALAESAGLSGTWEAILGGHPNRNPYDKLSYPGPIYNIKGEEIVRSSTQFWNNVHSIPLNYDENGQTITPTFGGGLLVESGFVWTGTTSSGNVYPGGECDNWSSASSSVEGFVGDPSNITDRGDWINQTTKTCDKTGHLLCIEAPTVKPEAVAVTAAHTSGAQVQVTVDFPATSDLFGSVRLIRSYGSTFTNYACENYYYGDLIKTYIGITNNKFEDDTVTDTVADGIYHYIACVFDRNAQLVQIARSSLLTVGTDFKRIFVSSATYNGNMGGVAGANALCSGLATAALLPGTYRALIAGSASNLEDNIVLTKNTYDFEGRFFAKDEYILGPYGEAPAANAVGTDENGDPVAVGTRVWTGSSALGIAQDHCNNWGSALSSDEGNYGIVNYYQNSFWKNIFDSVATCDQPNHIYCIQQ
jgi:hypothetical protein